MMEPGFYNMDCMDAMREFPDGFFDLAVVDPPYGDGSGNVGGAEVRRIVRPIQGGGTGSASASTDTRRRRIVRGGGITANGRMPANRGHLGGEIRQKNYCVGRGPRGRLLSGVVSRLTRTDYLGGQLLRIARDTVLSDLG